MSVEEKVLGNPFGVPQKAAVRVQKSDGSVYVWLPGDKVCELFLAVRPEHTTYNPQQKPRAYQFQ